ncbi:rRNA maturation RNase YbeY [Pelagibacterium xiamenense]|uniref:rRNA maturation RNase YbeY n=1 Tax=Pelagibacterium xiamenense TaxID=2901140 RepID=UPI001E2C43EF|nr:rRNA maturation RNase YbeY [Pelagibacterium xiamenense]MCD7058515.1 rRNA maturation RNase YbeY [Pelagibacterium xiamenense]
MLEIDIAVEDGDWPEGLEPLAETALRTALEHSGRQLAGPAELSVLLTDDAHQKDLNRQWRGKDSATNVLSFPQIEPDGPVMGLLGDISLGYETLVRETVELEKPFEHHFVHLLVHGMLHILGFDHVSENEALVMEARETDIMRLLGYPDPYDGTQPL